MSLEMPCIEWWGSVLPSGYGVITQSRERLRAHRFIWRECFGPLPDNVILHHKCRNKLCVNPEHLEPQTRAHHNAEHGQDATHCPKGHAYTDENTYWRVDKKRGWRTRKCRACHREQERSRSRG